MKVALHTVDLFPGRERLMPFRTILEVARVMNAHGWEADVLNSSVSAHDGRDYSWEGVQVRQCPRNFAELSLWVNERDYDAFFFAAPIREGLRNLSSFKEMKCRKIAYVPSGITPKWNALQFFRYYGMMAKAWLLEAFTPKTLLPKKLAKAEFTDIIGLTDYTSNALGSTLPTHTIYPGKDNFENIKSDKSILDAEHLNGEKFYLFTGAPGPVRGSGLLLKSIDKVCDGLEEPLPRFVFLVRNDVRAQYEQFNKALDGIKHKDCVRVIRKSLNVAQLKAFMEEAYAVVLPFICIPAEIPITYYEVMSCGTPVVSFANGGTTDYLQGGLKLAGSVSVKNLANALTTLWFNSYERKTLSERAKEIMSNHPTWDEVGRQWMNLLK